MSKNTIIVREFPGGGPASGEAYEILLEADDSVLVTGQNTSVDGAITYSPNGSPGPWRWEVDTGDTIRKGSSLHCGSGGSYSLAEIPIVLRALGGGVIDGYLNEMAVTYDGAGKDLDVATGAALSGQGIIGVWNTTQHYTVTATQHATNPKACYLIVATSGLGEADEGLVTIAQSCGAAAASPSLPALVQTDAYWEEPLATFTLPSVAAGTTLTNLTDIRRFAMQRRPQVIAAGKRIDPTDDDNVTSTTGAAIAFTTSSPNTTLLNGVVYDLYSESFLLVKAPASQTISIANSLNADVGSYVTSNVSSDYIGIGNSHSLLGVTGTGAAITNSLLAKVSSGTGSILTGYMLVVATPRS